MISVRKFRNVLILSVYSWLLCILPDLKVKCGVRHPMVTKQLICLQAVRLKKISETHSSRMDCAHFVTTLKVMRFHDLAVKLYWEIP